MADGTHPSTSTRSGARIPAPCFTDNLLIVMLKGGPYDRQDIKVSPAEWDRGSLARNGHRYDSVACVELAHAPALRIFQWIDRSRR